MKKGIICAIIALAGLTPIWSNGSQSQQQSSGKIRITLITMDSVNEHWLKVRQGAEDKAKELGNIELTFNAPPGKTDASVQLQMVEDAITKRAQVIMLAPLHADALVPGIEKARKAGIKIVLIDSGANTDQYDTLLATDNAAAARTAADTLGQLIGGQGKIAIMNAQAGAGTTMTRENAFKDQIAKKFPGITIVGTQYSDGDKTKALNYALDFMTANPDLAGFYGCNEDSSIGVANGVDQQGKTGIIKVVGFDWTQDTKSMIQRGVMQASMVQNPYIMGYNGVQAAADLMAGKQVPKLTDTGVTIAVKENADSIK
ncbi:MAG: ABC transporter substrate-binding protein [Spirochaetaceae bacterium]|jgi:ribose transport system substrate-binding protein|nr:ABC transporter substrate-binding protein [Spirochaetaceae bacterium]